MKAFVWQWLAGMVLAVSAAHGGEPGKLPLDYPAVPTTAAPGQWVLCPPREFVDRLQADGAVKTAVVFYAATMVEPGPAESKVVSLGKKEMTIPNSLIVAIPKGQTAEPGDVVLTWWQSGSGMNRARVVEGGTKTEPPVMYLDITYENPSGWGKKTDKCRPDSFCRLTKPMEVGTAVAVRNPKMGNAYFRHLVVNATEDQVLLLGYAGRLSVAARSACVPLPVVPEGLKEGESVWAATTFAKVQRVTVKRVDEKIGRAFVTFTAFGKPAELGVPFGDIARELP
jgi:hypothetical protein